MRLAKGTIGIVGISLLVLTGFIACAKNTSTASQGLDASRSQAKEIPSATEKAPPSHDSMVQDHSMTHNTEDTDSSNLRVALKDVYFDFDTPLIRSDMKGLLDSDASVLKKKNEIKVKIEGYCDERGTEEYNLALGNKRAYSVQSFLIAEGVDKKRLSTISYGKEHAVCNEHNEDCYKLNRRAHFNVQ